MVDKLVDLSLLSPAMLPIINQKRDKVVNLQSKFKEESVSEDLEEIIIKIDRDLVLIKDEVTIAQPSKENAHIKKRTRDQFESQLQDEESKALDYLNDSNINHRKITKAEEDERFDFEGMDLIANLVIGQCRPVSASRRRSSNQSFSHLTGTAEMVHLKMVA